MKLLLILSLQFLIFTQSDGFVQVKTQDTSLSIASSQTSSTTELAADKPSKDLGLTPELSKITNAFETIGDDKLRYKQLLYMAGQLAPMDPASMVPENKVIGCLSTVYVDGKVVGKDRVIEFTGDSDGLLTKGLVALLIRGLSGNTAEQIQKVDPTFIKKAGIQSSLTPGRNNGFLNMLAALKMKALELQSQRNTEEYADLTDGAASDDSSASEQSIYDGIINTLQQLKPTSIELTDVSQNHADQARVEADKSHFELSIISETFEGLNLVKRHKLIYMLLGEFMPQIHELQITALTPEEDRRRK